MEGEEAQPAVIPTQDKDEDSEDDLDFEEYSDRTNKFFDCIIKKMENVVVNKIERALVTNITSDLNVVKALVVEFCTQNYMKAHVKRKVKCIEKEVHNLIKHLNNKREKKKEKVQIEQSAGKEKEVEKETEEEEKKKLIKTSEWLYSISKKTEKIKNLVSQFGSLPDEEEEEEKSGGSSSSLTGGKREKQKTVSNSTECHKMCIEESLLISPMIAASLKKSYDHLPPNLKLCLLTLAAFPEDFIIKKRPLIYWWMAEGFVVVTMEGGNNSNKLAEEVGEENFTQLIQLGLIQPWYESGNKNQPHAHVQGCSVHPWIRRMLVSIAMEAQLLEFFGIIPPDQHPHPPGNNNNPPPPPPPPPRSRRVCLYDDGEGDEDSGTWKTKNRKCKNFSERLKWIRINYNALIREREQNKKAQQDLKAVSERQRKLKCITDLNTLLAEVTHGKIKPWVDQDAAAFNQRRILLENQIEDLKKTTNDVGNNSGDNTSTGQNNIVKKLHDEQMELVNDIAGFEKQVRDQMNYLDRMLDANLVNDHTVVYNRIKNCKILQENEQLFGHNDLNVQFPFPMKKKRTTTSSTSYDNERSNNEQQQNDQITPSPVKKRTASDASNDEATVAAAAGRLLAIINVTQRYLDMEHEAFGKMKNLRTLHLGRWRDSLPVPHIEVENTRIFDALFHVAKHLKYLSLRGISRITALPSTISKCCNLQILDLKACYNLETLPSEIASLYKLTHLDVSECYLLQNTNLWSLVQHLQLLQTLKGLKVDQSTHYSPQALAGSLRKLSIILTTPTFKIDLLTSLSNLRILTITWRITTEKPKPGAASTENNPPQQQPAGEISDGDANTETTTEPKPEKSDEGDAKTESTTPQEKPEKSDEEVKGIETLESLKKLDLRCYPDKAWPNWVKKHSSLETLYITGGDLEEFPMADLDLQKLQVLRFKYLTKLKLDEDNTPQIKSPKFPSLISFHNHNIKSKK